MTCRPDCIGGFITAPDPKPGYTAVYPCPRCLPVENQRWGQGEYNPRFTDHGSTPGTWDPELGREGVATAREQLKNLGFAAELDND